MQGGLWPTIAAPVGVVTLLKVSSPPTTRLPPRVPGETLDICLPDQTMTTPSVLFSVLRASFWNMGRLEWATGGAEFIYDDDDRESW